MDPSSMAAPSGLVPLWLVLPDVAAVPVPAAFDEQHLPRPADPPLLNLLSHDSKARRVAQLHCVEDDLRWALREGAVLPEEAIHEVNVLHRFSFVRVDPDQAERAVEFLDGTKLKGKEIRLEIAKS